MILAQTLLLVALCALMAFGLQKQILSRPASPWMIWLRGLQGASAGVGLSALVAVLLAFALPYDAESRHYVFVALVIGLATLGLPIGVLLGIVVHFRTVPKA